MAYTLRYDARVVDNGSASISGDFTSGAFTTAASTLLVAVVLIDNQDGNIQTSDIPTPTTSGTTWVQKAVVDSVGRAFSTSIAIFMADSPGASTTTTFSMSNNSADWDNSVNGIDLVILEFDNGLAVASQTSLATASAKVDDDGAAADPGAQSITLSASPASTSYVLAAFAGDSEPGIGGVTPGGSFTELTERMTSGTSYLSSQTQIALNLGSTTVNWADLATGGAHIWDYRLLACEIKASSGGSPQTITGSTGVARIVGTSGSITSPTAQTITGSVGVARVVGRSGSLSPVKYPASISGRKVLDQNGTVFLQPTMSSWGLATQLSNADITTALNGVAANNFRAVTVFIGSGYSVGTGWNRYTNQAGQAMWTGTPWASSLGAGWSSVDWVVQECARLGMVAVLAFCGGFGSTGAGPDWESVTDTNMYNAGVAIATRYLSYTNIQWEIMMDSAHAPTDTRGVRIQNLFSGINDIEGTTARPVRWMEPGGGSTYDSAFNRGWYHHGFFNATVNTTYNYYMNSTEQFETAYGETTGPTGDCEPPYVGAPYYNSGDYLQQYRERNYATFLEGGCLINFGHEDWWPFGAAQLFSDGETWPTVQAAVSLQQAKYCWGLIDTYCKDATYAPTSSFVTTGAGSGDTKAAVGFSTTCALAYFPSSRTIVVDTTIITASGNVRLRWFDPSNNTYTSISASETKSASRSVTHPGGNSVGIGDWVLVVDSATGPQTIVGSAGSVRLVGISGTFPGWGVPQNVHATATGQTTITVTWDPVLGASGYDVERGGVIVATNTSSPFNDTGLTASTLYSYRVRAVG